jgi:hypothetical protein
VDDLVQSPSNGKIVHMKTSAADRIEIKDSRQYFDGIMRRRQLQNRTFFRGECLSYQQARLASTDLASHDFQKDAIAMEVARRMPHQSLQAAVSWPLPATKACMAAERTIPSRL